MTELNTRRRASNVAASPDLRSMVGQGTRALECYGIFVCIDATLPCIARRCDTLAVTCIKNCRYSAAQDETYRRSAPSIIGQVGWVMGRCGGWGVLEDVLGDATFSEENGYGVLRRCVSTVPGPVDGRDNPLCVLSVGRHPMRGFGSKLFAGVDRRLGHTICR